MLPTLSSRLLVTHLLVAAVALSLVGVLASQLFRHYYVSRQQQLLAAAADDLAAVLGRLMSEPDGAERVALVVRATSRAVGGRVCVFDARRNALVASSDLRTGSPLGPDADEMLCHTTASTRIEHTQVLCYPGPVISVVAPVREAGTGTQMGIVLVRRPLHEVEATLRTLSYLLGASGALAAALALALAVLVSRAIARPLGDMSRAASDLADGNFSARVERSGPPELRALAASLNHMADALAAAFADLSTERERLADILASMEEGVMRLDGAGRVEATNAGAERLLGRPADTLVGSVPTDWLPAESAEEMGAAMRAVLDGSQDHFVCLLQAPERTLRLRGSRAQAEDGGVVVVLADVTEAERLERLRREFVANASHELRAPLTSIQGFLGAVADGTAATADDRARCLRIAAEQAELMRRLVDQLLDLSRLQAGVAPFDMQRLDLGPIIAGAVEALSPQAAARDLTVTVQVDRIPPVRADGDRVMQVLVNLLDNAIRFSPRGGEVTVSAQTEAGAGRVVVSVRDEGPGIPEEDLPLIWERFHKADRARSRADGGAGLGLAIAREIVVGHGQEVSARNLEGRGAVLAFTLPLAGESAGSPAEL